MTLWEEGTKHSARTRFVPSPPTLLRETMSQPPPSPKVVGKRRATFAADPLLHPISRYSSRSALVASRFASGFQYHTPLRAHYACVNALAFSAGDGTWLASGGDDKRVLLWNSFGELRGAEPRATYRGARVRWGKNCMLYGDI